VHPFDIPDEAHPPVSVPELETPSETLPPEWINAEALSAAVGHASAWMARGSDPWHTDDVLNVARVYREFITGETS
jgi:hypothetical protein